MPLFERNLIFLSKSELYNKMQSNFTIYDVHFGLDLFPMAIILTTSLGMLEAYNKIMNK